MSVSYYNQNNSCISYYCAAAENPYNMNERNEYSDREIEISVEDQINPYNPQNAGSYYDEYTPNTKARANSYYGQNIYCSTFNSEENNNETEPDSENDARERNEEQQIHRPMKNIFQKFKDWRNNRIQLRKKALKESMEGTYNSSMFARTIFPQGFSYHTYSWGSI